MTEVDYRNIFDEYLSRFGVPLPCPACVNQAYVIEVAARYMAKCKPIPKSFNWWAHLPMGTAA